MTYPSEDMGDPNFMAHMQAGIDATLLFREGVRLVDAIPATLNRMRYLFGEEIQREFVETAVTLTYCILEATKESGNENRV
jgi:hypothetical protein